MWRRLLPLALILASSCGGDGTPVRTSWGSASGSVSSGLPAIPATASADVRPDKPEGPESVRHGRRIVDMHVHTTPDPERLASLVRIMDSAGIGVAVILGAGSTLRVGGGPSEFERWKAAADKLYPGRFLYFMSLDYDGIDKPDWPESAKKQVEEGHRLGAAGIKEWKRLGLRVRDGKKGLLKVDDPRLDSAFRRAGELGMPVSIHVADPKAFWEPYNDKNERWEELRDHKNWWFGDRSKFPPREELLEALNRVIGRHPKTTFVAVHFANNAEDIDWVERSLDRFPNMMADLAARIPEVGRHEPERVRRLLLKHSDRFVFGTDFQVYDKFILGSSGDADRPTEADAVAYYGTHWRYLETRDRNFAHMTPIQGRWTISGIGLPLPALRAIYFGNAERILGASLARLRGQTDAGAPGRTP